MEQVISYGLLYHSHAYLRNAWCQLDFFVVSIAWLPIVFPYMGNYSALRSLRALRPLRALKQARCSVRAGIAPFTILGNVMAARSVLGSRHVPY